MTTATCNRCGRKLKNPDYIEIGYGKVCAVKMGITPPPKHKEAPPAGRDAGQAPSTEGR